MLRDYQIKSVAQIREQFSFGKKKVLLWLATGSGKTTIFSHIVKEAVGRRRTAIVVVRGRKLVDQASQRLTREGVEHGVLMAKHWQYRPHLPVQVCSIDTLISRDLRPKADLIIIDEAHLACSKGYKEFISDYPMSYIVAVTATPYVESGLTHIADVVVHPIGMLELIERGYLVPFKPYAAPPPDLSGVHTSSSTKDYVVKELESAMRKGKLTGRIIEHWKRIANGLPTICFAVNISHSKFLTEQFLQNGISAEHCDADTSDDERNRIIKRLESGITKVVCNVGILCTGVDIPCLGAIVMARPTQSRNLFIQQAGRGTRVFPGKANCILLDHAGNIDRHGMPTDEDEITLEGEIKSTSEKEYKTCKECFCVYRGKKCPECGTDAPAAPIEIPPETNDALVEIVDDRFSSHLRRLKREAKNTGKKESWAYHKFIGIYGVEVSAQYLPQWFVTRYEQGLSDLFAKSPFKGVRGVL